MTSYPRYSSSLNAHPPWTPRLISRVGCQLMPTPARRSWKNSRLSGLPSAETWNALSLSTYSPYSSTFFWNEYPIRPEKVSTSDHPPTICRPVSGVYVIWLIGAPIVYVKYSLTRSLYSMAGMGVSGRNVRLPS